MKESILEVLMYLFEYHMKDNCDIQISEDTLIDELRQAGFGLDEIKRAFAWLEGLSRTSTTVEELKHVDAQSFRALAPLEYDRLNSECWGFLLFLEQVGILNPVCREIVLDRLMCLDPDMIDLAQVKWVTLMVLFNQPDEKAALKAMETLVLDGTLGEVH